MVTCDFSTRLGVARVSTDGRKIAGLSFVSKAGKKGAVPAVAKKCARELAEFLAGKRRRFSVPIEAAGTPFQKKVWSAISEIPYGETTTYAAIARKIGKPRAVRAVGSAIGANPHCVMVPCHRVIGSDGSLAGFAYGLPMKRSLLKIEGALAG